MSPELRAVIKREAIATLRHALKMAALVMLVYIWVETLLKVLQ